MSTPGALYFSQSSSGGPHVFVAERIHAGARVVETFMGMSAAWSPDGQSIAFVRPSVRGYDLIVRSLNTGEERLYPHAATGVPVVSPRWLPDGTGFVVTLSGPFYLVDVKTRAFKL